MDRIAAFAEDYLQNYESRLGQKLPPERKTATAVKWRPSSENLVKINFDGALFGESDEVGLGVVIRNSEGEVMVALSENIVKPPAAKTVELLAAPRAVLFSIKAGFRNSVFEGTPLLLSSLYKIGICQIPKEVIL